MELVPLDKPIPYFNEEAIRGFMGSLENLGPLCRSIEELQYLAIMRSIATQALHSPVSGMNPWMVEGFTRLIIHVAILLIR